MAVLWERSAIPWVNGDQAFSGAQAFFYDAGTTTPMITYTDAAGSIPHDHPVVANSMGIFPPIFLADQAVYKFRVEDADGVTVVEADYVAAPTTTPPEIPDSDTDPELLFATGDIKMAWRISAPNGWVRCNGRTIGAAASGATERANADAEDLFIFLWNNDSNLTVSGSRGGTADGDWTANKTIALPDFRGRVLAGLDSFGNSAANRITDAILGQDSDTIGRAGGAETHTLITAELPEHDHGGATGAGGAHGHPTRTNPSVATTARSDATGGFMLNNEGDQNYPAHDGAPAEAAGDQIGLSATHTHTVTSAGSGDAHNNLQPTIMVPYFIKL